MNHLSEEELVNHVYGDGADAIGTHIDECAPCAQAYAELQRDVAELRCIEPPEPGEGYEAHVWNAIRYGLPAYRPRRPWFSTSGSAALWPLSWFAQPVVRRVSYAALCAALTAGAFYAGRHWDRPGARTETANTKLATPQPRQPIVVVVLGDHLDRSERLLVELKHADVESADSIAAPLRDEARSLLAANSVCRKNAEQEGSDPALKSALDHLDHLLNEMANQPGGLNADSIAKLRQEMESDGLLFEVRVLRSRVRNGHTLIGNRSTGGTV